MKYLPLLILLFSTSLFAEFKSCKQRAGEYGNLEEMRYQVGEFKSGACFISLGPSNRYPLYRNFTFDSLGELLIFNSLGRGRPSQDTGARSYLFPVKTNELAFEVDTENDYLRVKNTDGRIWVFDARSSKIESISKMSFIEDPVVTRTNNGGVELTPTSGTLIDEGWRLGGLPKVKLKRKSIVKDSFGNTCSVLNKKLFKLYYDQGGSLDGATFIHDTKAKWNKFLDKSCRNIEL